MKIIALIAACALCLANNSHAAERLPASGTAHSDVSGLGGADSFRLRADARLPDLTVSRRDEIITPLTHLPQLPEPEVFAMMLVGLVLIGYRVSRDGGDKFR